MARCGNCGQDGHKRPTCKNKPVQAPTLPATSQAVPLAEATLAKPRMTHTEARDAFTGHDDYEETCSECGQEDHKLNCSKIAPESFQQKVPEEKISPEKILEEVVKLKPKCGLWIVNPARKRIAGKISEISKANVIKYETSLGAFIDTTEDFLVNAGYEFVDLSPRMLSWQTLM